MLHVLKDSSLICRGIAYWKKKIKGKLQKHDKCTNASLQAGDPSLLHLILHLEQGCTVLNSFDILQIHKFPSKEGCTSFKGNPAIFGKCDILQGIVERSIQLYQCY